MERNCENCGVFGNDEDRCQECLLSTFATGKKFSKWRYKKGSWSEEKKKRLVGIKRKSVKKKNRKCRVCGFEWFGLSTCPNRQCGRLLRNIQ